MTLTIDDIKSGLIQCIIVKDLSRFGRNYIETGYYIDTILPRLNAKMIAINDCFDSSNEEDRNSLAVPIKNLINEMYAKDASKKYSDSFVLHSRLGDTKIGFPPYGYLVDKSINQLVRDPETAPIVEIIFRWFIKGLTMAQIAERLRTIDVLCPALYKNLKYGFPVKSNESIWKGNAVSCILHNPTYCGDTFQGRSRNRKYNGEHIRCVDKSEWIVHENTHEPLVLKSDYSLVEKMLEKAKNERRETIAYGIQTRGTIENPFKNKVYCADCGIGMRFNRYQHGGAKDGYDTSYFLCYDDEHKYCNRRVYTDYLKIIVMDQIKNIVKIACEQKEIAKMVMNGENKRTYCLPTERKVMNLESKIDVVEDYLEKLYINLSDGVIDENDYKTMLEHYSKEKEKINLELQKQREELSKRKRMIEKLYDFANKYESLIDSQEYNQNVVNEMIERINIGANNSYEVVFSCSDLIAKGLETIGECMQ